MREPKTFLLVCGNPFVNNSVEENIELKHCFLVEARPEVQNVLAKTHFVTRMCQD